MLTIICSSDAFKYVACLICLKRLKRDNMELPGRRVHIVPVGFEVERVIKPLQFLRGEKAYLIPSSESMGFAKTIQKKLGKDVKTEIQEIDDYWDFEKNMDLMTSLAKQEIQNKSEIWFNLSSGSKLHATIGIILAQMLSYNYNSGRVHTYYARAEKYRKKQSKEYLTKGLSQIESITEDNWDKILFLPPLFKVSPPKKEELEVLGILVDNLMGKAEDMYDVIARESDSSKMDSVRGGTVPRTEHEIKRVRGARLLRLITPLVGKGFVKTTGTTRDRSYSITQSGKAYYNSFKSFSELPK